jgi:hypothetical protein
MARERAGAGTPNPLEEKPKAGTWMIRGAGFARNGYRKPALFLLERLDRVARTDLAVRYLNRILGFHTSDYVFDVSQVAIVHIPKTGGTTLQAVLGQLSADLFVNWHMHRPISRRCPPGRFSYVTILRDPTQRVWSYFCMARRGERGNPYSAASRRGLAYFLDHCWEVRDMTCRYLAGDPYKDVDEDRYLLAKANLKRVAFVGRFDRLVRDVRRLVTEFGGNPDQITIPHLRPSVREPLSDEDAALIESRNEFDRRLYRWFLDSRGGD